MSNLRILFVFSILIAHILTYPVGNTVRDARKICCSYYDGCGGNGDQYWYLWVPADVVFNCEEIIQNDNRNDFHSGSLAYPGQAVHPDFSGYAWEIWGCHMSGTGCYPVDGDPGRWCDEDDGGGDPCDDDDFGGGTNTWMKVWDDEIVRYNNDVCPSQFTTVRTWSSQTSCRTINDQIEEDQYIYVVDERAPNLEVPAALTVECPTNYVPDYTLGSASAIDQCTTTSIATSNSLTAPATCNAGSLVRTFTAYDRCGNSVSDTQVVQIVDTTPPIIPQLPTVTTTCDDTGVATTGTPADVGFYSCEQFVRSGVSYREFISGQCGSTSSTVGCNSIQGGINYGVAITAPGSFITLEFNDIRLANRFYSADPRGEISVYDGNNNGAPLLARFARPPAPGPITGTGATVYVEYNSYDDADTIIIDGWSAFYYGHKTTPDRTVTPAVDLNSDVIIRGPCEGTYTILRTWTASDECNNVGTMTQTIFVVDNTPPGINPPFPPQTNIVEQVDCLADFLDFNPSLVDACSATGATLTKQVTLGGASGQNFAFSIIQTYTATDGCDNTITWSYTQEIGYYPAYVSGVIPPSITNQVKGSPFTLSVGVAEVADGFNVLQGGNPTFCTSPVVIVADAGPALLSAGSDPCWTQAANGLIYCETTTVVTVDTTPIDIVLTVPTDYAPNSLVISFTIAERSLIDLSTIGFLFGANNDNVVILFATP